MYPPDDVRCHEVVGAYYGGPSHDKLSGGLCEICTFEEDDVERKL